MTGRATEMPASEADRLEEEMIERYVNGHEILAIVTGVTNPARADGRWPLLYDPRGNDHRPWGCPVTGHRFRTAEVESEEPMRHVIQTGGQT